MIRAMTWNLRDFCRSGRRETRTGAIAAIIAEIDPDIVYLQELRGPVADAVLHSLAKATGLDCRAVAGDYSWNEDGEIWPAIPAVARGDADFHVGLMWRFGITPVAGSWRAVGRAEGGLWHSAAVLGLNVGGRSPLTVVSYHADPFHPSWRFDDARRVVPLVRDHAPALIGADFNSPSAAFGPSGGFYDPDPLEGRDWTSPEVVFQAEWDPDPQAPLRVDRRAGEVFERCGLIDVAAYLGVPWQATSGHCSDDPHRPRRVDRFHASPDLAPALRSASVWSTSAAAEVSDHLPVVVELDEHLIGATA